MSLKQKQEIKSSVPCMFELQEFIKLHYKIINLGSMNFPEVSDLIHST